MTEEFVPRHLPMRQAKQNHLIVSIGSTRSNKSIKKVVDVRYFIRISKIYFLHGGTNDTKACKPKILKRC
ncbi:hypothetical protein H5410_050235 [Solanum commersonii]|uniref:Uncharacterized protein n=1 Tax=Solanum commersonii TaxID=4109 RepID=A0A9J5WXA4_SOLCO|nr:hypothetical protein H5410_050235 [Solanum commersonii]